MNKQLDKPVKKASVEDRHVILEDNVQPFSQRLAERSSKGKELSLIVLEISDCLVDCKECTGGYVSRILGRRWLCRCKCHSKHAGRLAGGKQE